MEKKVEKKVEDLKVFTVGPEKKCKNCKKTEEVLKKVVSNYSDAFNIEMEHKSIVAEDTLKKYGLLQGPAVIINDIVVSEGKVPKEKFINDFLKKLSQEKEK